MQIKTLGCVMVGVLFLSLSGCGFEGRSHKQTASPSPGTEGEAQALVAAEWYTLSTQYQRELRLRFLDRDAQVILPSAHPFPVGAQEAELTLVGGGDVDLESVEVITCCDKVLDVTFSPTDAAGSWLLEDFSLSNDRHVLVFKWSDGDRFQWQAHSRGLMATSCP